MTRDNNHHQLLMRAILNDIKNKQKPFVLKGGTALMFSYGLDRFSEDIDLDITTAFKGIPPISLKGTFQRLSPKFNITNINTIKETTTVSKYNIHYGENHTLKIEASYRTPLEQEQVKNINGINVVPIEKIADFKINSVIDDTNDSRTKSRDLYDANFILNNHPNAITDKQLILLSKLDLNNIEGRYRQSFFDDKLLNTNNKNVSDIVLEMAYAVEKIAKQRKFKQHHQEIRNNLKTPNSTNQQKI